MFIYIQIQSINQSRKNKPPSSIIISDLNNDSVSVVLKQISEIFSVPPEEHINK
jgi:hypothetical protein